MNQVPNLEGSGRKKCKNDKAWYWDDRKVFQTDPLESYR